MTRISFTLQLSVRRMLHAAMAPVRRFLVDCTFMTDALVASLTSAASTLLAVASSAISIACAGASAVNVSIVTSDSVDTSLLTSESDSFVAQMSALSSYAIVSISEISIITATSSPPPLLPPSVAAGTLQQLVGADDEPGRVALIVSIILAALILALCLGGWLFTRSTSAHVRKDRQWDQHALFDEFGKPTPPGKPMKGRFAVRRESSLSGLRSSGAETAEQPKRELSWLGVYEGASQVTPVTKPLPISSRRHSRGFSNSPSWPTRAR